MKNDVRDLLDGAGQTRRTLGDLTTQLENLNDDLNTMKNTVRQRGDDLARQSNDMQRLGNSKLYRPNWKCS